MCSSDLPRMCRPGLKATKGFSKREIADNVEGDKVEVLDHIDFSAFFCVLSHVADEEANILLNQRLLFSKLQCVLLQRLEFGVSSSYRSLREGMR